MGTSKVKYNLWRPTVERASEATEYKISHIFVLTFIFYSTNYFCGWKFHYNEP
jgi:hypothetical protein